MSQDAIAVTLAFGLVVLLLFYRRIKHAFLSIFGGELDKMEFAGLVFLIVLIYMVFKEANRSHEWHLFNDLYVLTVAGAAVTGLGLNSVLDTIKHIKGLPGETTTTVTKEETKTTQTLPDDSEVPK